MNKTMKFLVLVAAIVVMSFLMISLFSRITIEETVTIDSIPAEHKVTRMEVIETVRTYGGGSIVLLRVDGSEYLVNEKGVIIELNKTE